MCRAKQLVEVLRILADCFDDKKEDAEVIKVIGDRFECSHPRIDNNPSLVKTADDWPEFPPDLKGIVSEICDLNAEISPLSELLKTELDTP